MHARNAGYFYDSNYYISEFKKFLNQSYTDNFEFYCYKLFELQLLYVKLGFLQTSALILYF